MIRKVIINTVWMVLMIAISGLVYIRLAPDDAVAAHQIPLHDAEPGKPQDLAGGIIAEELFHAAPDVLLKRLNAIALKTPRTRVLAGSTEEGMITYVTRSMVFGFPDYTTVQVRSDGQRSRLTIFGRLRFGVSDFKVNSARVHSWLQALKALEQF